MTPTEDLMWIGIGAAMVIIPSLVLVVMDFRMMTIQGEAVQRGYAEVRDGKWMWRDEE
ncbi:MAG: hypothetical protein ACP5QR_05005 [Rhizomicrobium sp.]